MTVSPYYLAGLIDGTGEIFETHIQFVCSDRPFLERICMQYPGGKISSNMYGPRPRHVSYWVRSDTRSYTLMYIGEGALTLVRDVLPFTFLATRALAEYLSKYEGAH